MKTDLSRRNFIKALTGTAVLIAAPTAVSSVLRPAPPAPPTVPAQADANSAPVDDTEAWLLKTGEPHIDSSAGFMFA